MSPVAVVDMAEAVAEEAPPESILDSAIIDNSAWQMLNVPLEEPLDLTMTPHETGGSNPPNLEGLRVVIGNEHREGPALEMASHSYPQEWDGRWVGEDAVRIADSTVLLGDTSRLQAAGSCNKNIDRSIKVQEDMVAALRVMADALTGLAQEVKDWNQRDIEREQALKELDQDTNGKRNTKQKTVQSTQATSITKKRKSVLPARQKGQTSPGSAPKSYSSGRSGGTIITTRNVPKNTQIPTPLISDPTIVTDEVKQTGLRPNPRR